MADEAEDRIPGERAETDVSPRTDASPFLRGGAVVLAMVAFVGISLWSMRDRQKTETTKPDHAVIRQTADFEPAKEEVELAAPLPDVLLPTPAPKQQLTPAEDTLLDSARR